MPLDSLNLVIGSGAVALQVLAAAFLVVFFAGARGGLQGIGAFLARYGLWLGFLLTLCAAALSLVHSHVYGLPPCDLCWWQRIFIYPQVVLFALALWRRDSAAAVYSIALSILGAGVALYHHALQMLPAGTIPCPATGPSCAQILFLEFGYVTYPMLSLSLFAFLIVTMLFVRRSA